MSVISRMLDAFGLQSYIKLPGKGFSNLTPAEVSSMIDAFLNGENASFQQNALYEFVLMRYRNSFLTEARERIEEIQNRFRTADKPDGLASDSGKAALASLANEFRGRQQ